MKKEMKFKGTVESVCLDENGTRVSIGLIMEGWLARRPEAIYINVEPGSVPALGAEYEVTVRPVSASPSS